MRKAKIISMLLLYLAVSDLFAACYHSQEFCDTPSECTNCGMFRSAAPEACNKSSGNCYECWMPPQPECNYKILQEPYNTIPNTNYKNPQTLKLSPQPH